MPYRISAALPASDPSSGTGLSQACAVSTAGLGRARQSGTGKGGLQQATPFKQTGAHPVARRRPASFTAHPLAEHSSEAARHSPGTLRMASAGTVHRFAALTERLAALHEPEARTQANPAPSARRRGGGVGAHRVYSSKKGPRRA